MDYNQMALDMHELHKGKIEVVSKVAVKTREDLSTAYTPGVAQPCRKIRDKKSEVYRYTAKGNLVAVVSDGTAVLGLGDIGPEAAMLVIEGKAILFKTFAGISICKLLQEIGMKHIVLVDRNGALAKGETWMNEAQAKMAEVTNQERQRGGLEEIIKGKDVFIGVSAPGVLSADMAAYAIAGIIEEKELNEEYIIPGAFDERVAKAVAEAVKQKAIELKIVK